MADVQYWDTLGVTNMAALENNRIGLKFSDADGVNRILTIPAGHIIPLILSLTDFASKVTKTHDVGETLSDVQMLKADSMAVGSAKDGSSFSLVVHTIDQLEACFQLPPQTTQALAAGLIQALSEHGLEPENLKPDGQTH